MLHPSIIRTGGLRLGIAVSSVFCVLFFCQSLADPIGSPDYLDGDYLLILTSEYLYEAGSFSTMDLDPPWEHDDNLGPMCADKTARLRNGLIYVVNRMGCDNIQVLDPEDNFNTLLQFSVGIGSNPHDICFVNDHRAFVTRHQAPELWEVDPTTGDLTDTIDLSPLADADGIPEMDGMATHDGLLYVTLQRLDQDGGWIPVPPSYLAVIDLEQNALLDMDPVTPGVQGIELASLNPNSLIHTDPISQHFLIGEAGDWGVLDGGIERFDPQSQQSLGLVVTEAALGGDVNEWDTADGMLGFAVAVSPSWSTQVVKFDLQTGQNMGTVASSDEYAYAHLLVDPPRRQLFLADRTYADPGIRVFDTGSIEPLTPDPIPVGLYPHWLLTVHGPETAVEPDPHTGWLAGFRIYPRPAATSVHLQFELERAAPVELEVLEVGGRRVAAIFRGRPVGQRIDLCWDGRDAQGKPLPTGTYLARLRCGDQASAQKIQLVR